MPFTICDPKQRQIHKASVRDRLVHQALVSAIEPIFERQFIYDSYSCRQNKGTHAAVKRLQVFLRRASANNTKTVFALKCDIKRFFASVDHQVLMDLLTAKIPDPDVQSLVQEVVDSFQVTPGKGIPLGNLTSQLFANIYLNELDHFAKHELREKHYLRYCDDFIILGTDRAHLQRLIATLAAFLRERLCLTLHPDKISLRSWAQGVDFLGYVIKPECIVLRHKTKLRMLQRVNVKNLSSYLGLCSHADEYELSRIASIKAHSEIPSR